jgi:valyl-tRNA synthetase
MPFITEELYHHLEERNVNDGIVVASWPTLLPFDQKVLDQFAIAQQIIAEVRTIRKQKNIPAKQPLDLYVKSTNAQSAFDDIIAKLSPVNAIQFVTDKPQGALGFVVKGVEYFVPVAGNINVDEERAKLQKEIEYNIGFLNAVQKKLANERFVQNAKPEVLDVERRKQADAEAKIKALQEQLANL